MPNRILRDWTDSESIDSLDVNAERFFTRLIMKVDDYGRYFSNPKLLKSNLYPLKSDIRETDISRWLTACEKAGLITLYNVAAKGYLQIENFKQVLRQKVEKYPSPALCDAIDMQTHSNSNTSASLKRNESETNPETKTEGSQATSPLPSKYSEKELQSFKTFEEWIKINAPNVAKLKEPFTIDQYLNLAKKGYDVVKIQTLLKEMHNWKPLLQKRVSANLTLLNWANKNDM